MPSKSVSVLLEACAPLPRSLALSLPQDATTADILAGIEAGLSEALPQHALHERFYLTSSTAPGQVLPSKSTPLKLPSTGDHEDGLTILRVYARMLGGKGGFGSMLRAAGGKMSAKQGQGNTDSCRDLNGRRLSVMKEAKALATYIENEPARLKALDDAQRKKYAKLERMSGRQPKAAADFEEAARRLADAEEEGDEQISDENENDRGEGSSRSTAGIGARSNAQASRTSSATAPAPIAGIKRKERLEDREYVEQSREIVDNVRSAVAAAMMKKRKKAKTTPASSSGTAPPKAAATVV
ncbi:hypothetical protein V8E36_003096 [Tilletia maclaganii]